MIQLAQRAKQRGAVTLVVTLLVLVAISVGSFSMVQSSSLESRMTAHDRQGKEALQAAQAGIDRVLAGLAMIPANGTDDEITQAIQFLCQMSSLDDEESEPPFFELNFDGPQPIGGDPNNGWELVFPSSQASCEANPFGLLTRIQIWSRGYSANRESSRTITSIIDISNDWRWRYPPGGGSGGGGEAPVVTKGNAHFQGTPEVALCITRGQCEDLARPGNMTGVIDGQLVRAGGSITDQGNVPMGEENYEGNDSVLATMDSDMLFRDFSSGGMSIEEFRNSENTFHLNSSESSSAVGADTNQIWVDGDFSLRNGTIGSYDNPVIIYVAGDLTLAGNAIIWGVVHVAGQADFSVGTNKIMGSLVAEGNVSMRGNAAVYYNADLRPNLSSGVVPTSGVISSASRQTSMRIGSWTEIGN